MGLYQLTEIRSSGCGPNLVSQKSHLGQVSGSVVKMCQNIHNFLSAWGVCKRGIKNYDF